MYPECVDVDVHFLTLSSNCDDGAVGYKQGKKCGNTPSKRKYKNFWIRGFDMPAITNDYCSSEWADFAQMSVYGAINGREQRERNDYLRSCPTLYVG